MTTTAFTGRRSIHEIRFPLLHMRHHRLDLIGFADDLDLFVAFSLQYLGIVRVGQQVAQSLGAADRVGILVGDRSRSEEHTSELQSLMRISYAVLCLQKQNDIPFNNTYSTM